MSRSILKKPSPLKAVHCDIPEVEETSGEARQSEEAKSHGESKQNSDETSAPSTSPEPSETKKDEVIKNKKVINLKAVDSIRLAKDHKGPSPRSKFLKRRKQNESSSPRMPRIKEGATSFPFPSQGASPLSVPTRHESEDLTPHSHRRICKDPQTVEKDAEPAVHDMTLKSVTTNQMDIPKTDPANKMDVSNQMEVSNPDTAKQMELSKPDTADQTDVLKPGSAKQMDQMQSDIPESNNPLTVSGSLVCSPSATEAYPVIVCQNADTKNSIDTESCVVATGESTPGEMVIPSPGTSLDERDVVDVSVSDRDDTGGVDGEDRGVSEPPSVITRSAEGKDTSSPSEEPMESCNRNSNIDSDMDYDEEEGFLV